MPIADEISLTNAEGFTLPQIVPEVRRRQVDALRTCPDMDLNAAVLDWALGMLGGLDIGTTAYLIVPDGNRETAERLAKEFRLAAIIVPPQVMPNPYSWTLVGAKGSVFSTPTS